MFNNRFHFVIVFVNVLDRYPHIKAGENTTVAAVGVGTVPVTNVGIDVEVGKAHN